MQAKVSLFDVHAHVRSNNLTCDLAPYCSVTPLLYKPLLVWYISTRIVAITANTQKGGVIMDETTAHERTRSIFRTLLVEFWAYFAIFFGPICLLIVATLSLEDGQWQMPTFWPTQMIAVLGILFFTIGLVGLRLQYIGRSDQKSKHARSAWWN
jgi:hypothetical protein